MDEYIEKMPNWLRYILSIPFGIICVIFVGTIIYISNLIFSDPNSIWTIISNFIFANGLNVIIFFYGFNLMLPDKKFTITLVLSIIIGITYSILQGISIGLNIISFEYILAYIIFITSLILSCYLSYKNMID